MELTLTSTIIDKTVPIYIIGMKNNEVSQWYEKQCIDNFKKFFDRKTENLGTPR